MKKVLTYSVENYKGQFNLVKVYGDDKLVVELDCLLDSPYSIEEEIQEWLDDNGFGDEEFEFEKL